MLMAEIKLTQNKVAIVDDADFEWLNQWKRNYYDGYAWRNAPRRIDGTRPGRISMHRQIMNDPKGLEIDHKDLNKLNNQRGNLRVATRGQNQSNTKIYKNNKSGYKGVRLVITNKTKPYQATISFLGKYHHLGYFVTALEAARAYDQAALIFNSEFARINNV